jgi:tyrosine-protein kinase Etk/Wzc
MQTSELEQNHSALDDPGQDIRNPHLDVLDVMILLARRKRLILSVTLGAVVVSGIVSLLLPKYYTASTKILPPQQSQSASSLILSQLSSAGAGPLAALSAGGLGLKKPTDIYLGILKSRSVEDALIGRFDLQRVYKEKFLSLTRKQLENATEIETEKEGLISISVEDKDPKRAAALVMAYVSQLRELTQHLAVSEASQRRLFFEDQMRQAKDSLSIAEMALKESEQKTGMIQLEGQAKALIEAVGTLRAQIAAKEVEIQAMSSFATDQNPQKVMAQQQLIGLKAQYAKLVKQGGFSEGDPLVAMGNVPALGLEYLRRLRDVKYSETIFELLAKQFEAAKIDEAREAALIQVVDPAVEPDRKSSPRRAIIIALSTVVSIFLVVLYCLLAELLRRLRQFPEHAQRLRIFQKAFLERHAK